ncbi:MAG: uroporphyrinogen-III synthase [Legionella sp.]|nr:MAG: uroporphyrinogen-III synthase [Legionella sp.]
MIKTLNGLRILNTRPIGAAKTLTHELIEAGGLVIECPTLAIQEKSADWVNHLPALQSIQHAIFISPNAVHFAFKHLQEQQITWPKSINLIPIGQATANALKEQGLFCNDIPSLSNSEHLLELPALKHVQDQSVLLFKGVGGRPLIEEVLGHRGAKVFTQLLYERVMPRLNPEWLELIWRNNQVDIILLTSEQSIENLFKLFGKEASSWLQTKPCLVISDRLAHSASIFGIQNIIKSHPEKIINTLFDYSQGLFHGQ